MRGLFPPAVVGAVAPDAFTVQTKSGLTLIYQALDAPLWSATAASITPAGTVHTCVDADPAGRCTRQWGYLPIHDPCPKPRSPMAVMGYSTCSRRLITRSAGRFRAVDKRRCGPRDARIAPCSLRTKRPARWRARLAGRTADYPAADACRRSPCWHRTRPPKRLYGSTPSAMRRAVFPTAVWLIRCSAVPCIWPGDRGRRDCLWEETGLVGPRPGYPRSPQQNINGPVTAAGVGLQQVAANGELRTNCHE